MNQTPTNADCSPLRCFEINKRYSRITDSDLPLQLLTVERPMASDKQINVEDIAKLARVELTVEEAAEFQKEIESILGYVEELSAVDVEGIEPMAHATAITNVFGKDVPGPQLDREAILGNAPETLDDELIRVPKVIEDGDGGTH
jgi:aspartyl-tRNA(Asn)/glutamyl-tRNA(Gln) amidotransferase subunit C